MEVSEGAHREFHVGGAVVPSCLVVGREGGGGGVRGEVIVVNLKKARLNAVAHGLGGRRGEGRGGEVRGVERRGSRKP